MAISFETAVQILSNAQSILDEAIVLQHKVGDTIDRARNEINGVASLGDIKGIQALLVQAQKIENDAHQTMVHQMNALKAHIDLVKRG